MKPYIAIVHQEGESAYGVSFSDALGCFSAADELDDLFAMATEALEGWTEGMIEEGLPIPPTRDLSEIKADPEWTESFEGAVLVIALPVPGAGSTQQAA
ncbi:MAG: HicB family protein [Methylocystaceae bacterium]|nr:MAG: HicB family protein [Methylocystaceae bacterium]